MNELPLLRRGDKVHIRLVPPSDPELYRTALKGEVEVANSYGVRLATREINMNGKGWEKSKGTTVTPWTSIETIALIN